MDHLIKFNTFTFENSKNKPLPREISKEEYNEYKTHRCATFTDKEKDYIKSLFNKNMPLEDYFLIYFSSDWNKFQRPWYDKEGKIHSFKFEKGINKSWYVYKTDDDYYLISKQFNSSKTKDQYFLADQIKELINYLENYP